MQTPRIYCPSEPAPTRRALVAGATLTLPDSASRHIQVLRMQPGDVITLFDGWGGEFESSIVSMSRTSVAVLVGKHQDIVREPIRAVHLAMGIPTNDRMDDVVEKATELGVASITPLLTERSVLRLTAERADKRLARWQAIAIAACEQCGRNAVPTLHPIQTLKDWLPSLPRDVGKRAVLSLQGDAQRLSDVALHDPQYPWLLLSGPEGGLSPQEERLAASLSFEPISLGLRVLRADTAPLAALAALTL